MQLFLCGDGLAFHDPFDGGLAIDDVVVFQRDVADGHGAYKML